MVSSVKVYIVSNKGLIAYLLEVYHICYLTALVLAILLTNGRRCTHSLSAPFDCHEAIVRSNSARSCWTVSQKRSLHIFGWSRRRKSGTRPRRVRNITSIFCKPTKTVSTSSGRTFSPSFVIF